MITKMTKYDFVVHHSDYDSFLENVRDLGVLHIATLERDNDTYNRLHDQFAQQLRIDKLIEYCQQIINQHNKSKKKDEADKYVLADEKSLTLDKGWEVANGLEKLIAQQETLNAQLSAAEREVIRMAVWGCYSNNDIERLSSNGLIVSFYSCPTRNYDNTWEETYNAFVINTTGSSTYFITVTHKPITDIEAEPFAMNERSTIELQTDVDNSAKLCEQQKTIIKQYAFDNVATLQRLSAQLSDEISLEQAHVNTEYAADDTIMIIEGYCPDDICAELDTMLQTKGVYYQKATPTAEDNVPIKLRNNWFSKLFEPLTGMYGMPVYQEFDPTPILGPFFLLFFALCMGDAGYGIILILLGLGLKSGKVRIEMFDGLGPIITALGVGTLVIGFFIGTAFGIDLYAANWMPEALKSVMIKGEIAGYDIQMIMAIIIGVFHICLAMTIKAICYTKRWGFKQCLSNWGWLILIVGGIATAILAVGDVVSIDAAKYTIIAIGIISAFGIFIFNNPKRNVFANIGSGLWDTYNMATGLLGDVLSYIRLYALGLAGGMLGGAFNNLGAMVLGDEPSILSYLPYILILLFGHTLNLAMSALGAFVHPLRLTFVEYFKNSGYEGKGNKYAPLVKTVKE